MRTLSLITLIVAETAAKINADCFIRESALAGTPSEKAIDDLAML